MEVQELSIFTRDPMRATSKVLVCASDPLDTPSCKLSAYNFLSVSSRQFYLAPTFILIQGPITYGKLLFEMTLVLFN